MGNQYGRLERGLANVLTSFPGIKKVGKKAYQRINYYLHRKPYHFRCAYPLHALPVEGETFFGYYDKSPLSPDGCFMLFNRPSQSTSALPAAEKAITVCLYDTLEKRITAEYPTFSYNWQQGAKAQWLTEKEFIFNEYDADSHQYHAMIVQTDSEEKRSVCRPVYDCFRDQYALTLNFRRLMALRPDYGYRNETPMTENELSRTDDDGIFYVDLIANSSKLLLSLDDILEISPLPVRERAFHKVNHIMISPDGSRFIFLHRYFVQGRKYDRLLVADRDGQKLRLLADDDMVSHCCWKDENHIVGYLRDKTEGDRYYQINIATGEKTIVGRDKIDRYGDGHPGIYQNSMVFDTYPDKARMKHLFRFDLETEHLQHLGEFYESFEFYGETRCDLHPRFSMDGKRIFFDSVHEGKRKLYWINL